MFTITVCSGDSKTADQGLTRETVLDEEEEEAEEEEEDCATMREEQKRGSWKGKTRPRGKIQL